MSDVNEKVLSGFNEIEPGSSMVSNEPAVPVSRIKTVCASKQPFLPLDDIFEHGGNRAGRCLSLRVSMVAGRRAILVDHHDATGVPD